MTRSLLVFLLFLAACGQSGPLYLPGDPSEIRDAPPPQSEADSDEDEDEESAGGG